MDLGDAYLALISGNADNITRRGHAQMRSLSELPLMTKDEEEKLTKLGFKFSDVPTSRPKLFRSVEFPEGWKIVPTDHYMYSNLVDPKGRVRAQIGFKSSDSWSQFFLYRRFRASWTKDDHNDRSGPVIACIVNSNGKELWRGPSFPDRLTTHETATKAARVVLDKIAPDADNVEAYWDEAGDALQWPEHETPVDTRKEYLINTQCYRDGHYRDGGTHASCKAVNLEEARTKLLERANSLIGHGYDEVRWAIVEKDVAPVLERGTLHRPPPPPRLNERMIFGPDGRPLYGPQWLEDDED